MAAPPSPPSLSRRTFLASVGACLVTGVGSTRTAAVTTTEEWVRLWELPVEPPQQTPAEADETVFVPSAGVIRSVDVETGDADWVTTVGDPIAQEGLIASGDRLYAGTDAGTVRCLDSTDGELIWSESVDSPVEGLQVSHGCLLVQTSATLHCLDTSDGSVHWQTPSGADTDTDRPVSPVTDGTTAIGSRGGEVFAVTLDSGESLWRQAREEDDSVTSLAIWKENVIVGRERTTEMLTLGSGEALWTRSSGARHLSTVAGSAVYSMESAGTVVIEPESGRSVGSFDLQAALNGGPATGEIDQYGTVVTLSGDQEGIPTVLIVDPEVGTVIWKLTGDPGGEGFGRAVLADERLVVQDLGRNATIAFGEPSDDAVANGGISTTKESADAGRSPGDGDEGATSGGFRDRMVAVIDDLDTTVTLASLVLTIGGGLVWLARRMHNRTE